MRITMKYLKKKAQSTVEYGILIGVIIAAVVAMQTYLKRSLQAKQKDAADMLTSVNGKIDIAGGANGGNAVTMTLNSTNQYEPYYLIRHQQGTTSKENLTRNIKAGGATTITKNEQHTTQSAVIYRAYNNSTNNNQP